MTTKRDWRGGAGGIFMIAFGAGLFLYGLDYSFGSVFHMGPGFFPRVLAVLMVLVGLILLYQAMIRSGVSVRPDWRPLLAISGSLVLFGMLIGPLGLLPTTIIVAIVAAFGDPGFRPLRAAVLACCLGAFVVTLFAYGLGLPIAVIGSF